MTNTAQPTEPPGGWRRRADSDSAAAKEAPTPPSRSATIHRTLPHVDVRRSRPATPSRPVSPQLTPSVDHHAPTATAPAIPTPAPPPSPTVTSTALHPADLLPLTILACLAFLPAGLVALVLYRRANRLRIGGDYAATTENSCRTAALIGVTVGLAVVVATLSALAF